MDRKCVLCKATSSINDRFTSEILAGYHITLCNNCELWTPGIARCDVCGVDKIYEELWRKMARIFGVVAGISLDFPAMLIERGRTAVWEEIAEAEDLVSAEQVFDLLKLRGHWEQQPHIIQLAINNVFAVYINHTTQ